MLYDALNEDNYGKEYFALRQKYKYMQRYSQIEVQLRDGLILVPDMESFLCAYESILVQKIYAFNPRCKNNVTILDFGSNIGVSLYFFAKNYPTAKIEGFEADPHIYNICLHNLRALNCVSNVSLHNTAVWTQCGEVDFYSEGADAGHVIDDSAESAANGKVKCCDALSIIQKYGHIDFLKIDIEGAETEVLQRIEFELCRVDNIFIEYHSSVNRFQTLDKVVHILIKTGFRIYFGSDGLKQQTPYVATVSYQGFDGLLNIYGVRGD